MKRKRNRISRTEVRLSADVKEETRKEEPREDETFVIVVMGDFSGAVADRPAGGLRLSTIDRENFNEAMRRVGPRRAEAFVSLSFAELDDFHPDRIAGRVPALRALLQTREELSNPSQCERILLSLCSRALDLGRLLSGLGYDLEANKEPMLRRMIEEKMALLEGGVLRLTPKGCLVCDGICRGLAP